MTELADLTLEEYASLHPQVWCDNCSGPHLEKDCPLVCYSFRDRFDERRPRPNWKPFEEYESEREYVGTWRQTGQGYYQEEPQWEQPVSIPEKKPSLEEIVTRFLEASEKRHKDAETDLINQQASFLNIEYQVGQISRILQERLLDTLPSITETNPNAHVKEITARSDKNVEPLAPLATNIPPSEKERESEPKPEAKTSLLDEFEHELQELGDIEALINGPFDPEGDLRELERLLAGDLEEEHEVQDFGTSEQQCFEVISRPMPWIYMTNSSLEITLERDPFYVSIQLNVILYGILEEYDPKLKWLITYIRCQNTQIMNLKATNEKTDTRKFMKKKILSTTDELAWFLTEYS